MRLTRMRHEFLPIAAAVAAACASAAPARADTAATPAAPGESGDRLTEIIVTAQRREQNVQEVGTSITAFDTHTLESLGLHDIADVAGQVPGLQFNQYGATVTIINLRGVSQNDFSDHQEAPVAVYFDDAYLANTGAISQPLYDLQRIEVLRGPQGTLFGRNATGGLIQYISAPPTDQLSGYLQATGGNFGTVNTEGAISGPVADRLTARASFSTQHHDGYISNRIGHSINDQRQYAGRLQLHYQLSENGEATLKLHALTNDRETAGNYSWAASAPIDTLPNGTPTGRGVFTPGATDFGGYTNPSNDPFVQSEDRRGLFNRTMWGSTLHVNWKFDSFSLVSVTDYFALQKRYGEDSDMSPNPIFNYDTGSHFQQFSEELRLNGTAGSLRWITGLYYLNYHQHNFEATALPDFLANPFFGPPPTFLIPYGRGHADLALSTSSPSVFGQLEYDFGRHWTGILGARYTSDDKHYVYSYNCDVCSLTAGPYSVIYSTAAGFPDAAKTYHIPTGKAELDYKFNRDAMLYASVNRGAKGGGWSAPSSGYVNLNPALTPPAYPPYLNLRYNDERLTSYELGAKTTWLNGALRLNGDVFYYDYKQYQGFFLDVATQIVENINARVKGGEIEFAAVPVHGLNVQLGGSYLDSTALNVPTNAGASVNTQLPQAPRWTFNAVARYEWPLAGGRATIEGDVKWNAKQYLELANAPVDLQPSYAVANARLGYATGDGRWDVSVFAHNLADRWYRVYNLDLSGFLGINQGVYGAPRTYGGTVSYHW